MEDKQYRIEKCDSKVQWDEFVLEHHGHPMQLWGWGDVRTGVGWQVDRLFVVEDDEPIAAVQLLIKRLPRPFTAVLYVPRGPVIVRSKTAVYEQFAAYVKHEYKGVALVVEPDDDGDVTGAGWRESDQHAQAGQSVVLDLSKADGVLLADMSATVREHIRTAIGTGLTCKKLGNPDDIAACYRLYTQSPRATPGKPLKEKYFHDLSDKLGEFSALFGAYDGEELVSFLWLTLSEMSAVEIYRGATTRGRDIQADAWLRWEVIRRIKQWGVGHYDVGGVANEADTLAGYGAHLNRFGTFELPLSPLYGVWARAGRRGRSHYAI